MRRAITWFVVVTALCTPSSSAERRSWNRIRYAGGTIPVKTSPYDWNTTLTVSVNPNMIVLEIAPVSVFQTKQIVRMKPSQVTSLSAGPAAWRRVGEVSGAQLPAKSPALFGLLKDFGFLGIVYQTDDGKSAAILLDSYFSWQMLRVLKAVTGKEIEESP
ncbi:MAG: hypothetical protein LAQ69_05365 [Acidobacteriia bacterium]|nr:hypothetical protein [Terriglobia bacterium]